MKNKYYNKPTAELLSMNCADVITLSEQAEASFTDGFSASFASRYWDGSVSE